MMNIEKNSTNTGITCEFRRTTIGRSREFKESSGVQSGRRVEKMLIGLSMQTFHRMTR